MNSLYKTIKALLLCISEKHCTYALMSALALQLATAANRSYKVVAWAYTLNSSGWVSLPNTATCVCVQSYPQKTKGETTTLIAWDKYIMVAQGGLEEWMTFLLAQLTKCLQRKEGESWSNRRINNLLESFSLLVSQRQKQHFLHLIPLAKNYWTSCSSTKMYIGWFHSILLWPC